MNHPCTLLSADLSSVMLITDSSSEIWTAPSLPESPDALILRSRIDEAASWTAKQPAVRRRLNAAVLDIADATCRWVQSPSAAAPVVAATLRNQTEEWSARLPLGGIEPIIDELPRQRSFEFIRSRMETRSSRDRTEQDREPTNTAATETGARMAVLIMPDALVRLWLDRMDRSGVSVDAVLSLWHALVLSWGDEQSTAVRAVVMVEGDGRVVWAWASGTRLIVGGSLQLERPETGESSQPNQHRAEAAAQRISLDWVTWSAQLGVAPDEIVMVAGASDTLAEELARSLGSRWEGVTTRQNRSDHPLRETVARAGAAIRSTPIAERGPRRWMSRLSTRPSRATRRRYLASSFALVFVAIAIAAIGYRLGKEGESRHEAGTTMRGQTLELVSEQVPDFNAQGPDIVIQLNQRIADLRQADPFTNPPSPRPIYEDTLALLEYLQEEYSEAKIRQLKFSQSSQADANTLELELPSVEVRTELIDRLRTLPFRVEWSPRSNRSNANTLLNLQGRWKEAPTP